MRTGLPRPTARRGVGACVTGLGAAACLLFAVTGAAAPTADVVGALSQLAEERGCVLENPPASTLCTQGRALDGASAVAVSPDGKNVYVAAANAAAIAVFRRDQRTGALQQLAGPAGCVGGAGCRAGPGLGGVRSVVVSPDGRNVYATSPTDNQVVVLVRDPATGALSVPPTPFSCVRESGGACLKGRGLLRAQAVVVSPDGKNVYVAGQDSDAISIYLRDPNTGHLAPLLNPGRCVALSRPDCYPAPGLDGPLGLAVSPDGRWVFAVSNVTDALSIFSRNASVEGLLTPSVPLPCVAERPAAGCLSSGQGRVQQYRIDSPSAVAVIPELAGKALRVVVVSRVSNAVRVFTDRGGPGQAPFFLPDPEDCTTSVPTECRGVAPVNDPSGVAVSPDGRHVYVSSWGNLVTALLPDGTFLNVPGGCISPPGKGCTGEAFGLDQPSGIAMSPDGKNVYVTSFGSDGVIALARSVADTVAPRVGIGPGTVTLTRARTLRLRLSCPLAETQCSGTLSLRNAARRVNLGSATFSMSGGVTAGVTVRVSAAGRKAVAAARRLPATATAVARDAAGNRGTNRRRITVKASKG